jgi:hypothetical protein
MQITPGIEDNCAWVSEQATKKEHAHTHLPRAGSHLSLALLLQDVIDHKLLSSAVELDNLRVKASVRLTVNTATHRFHAAATLARIPGNGFDD